MITAGQVSEPLGEVQSHEHHIPKGGPAWLRSVRERAMACLTQRGFPTTGLEEWRFLDVSPILTRHFVIPVDGADLSRVDLERFIFPGLSCTLLVFVNGRYREDLSHRGALPGGAQILSLAEALDTHADVIRPHLSQYADFENEPFTALNTAMIDDGVVVYMPPGMVLPEPIHVLNVAMPRDKAMMTNPRLLVVAEESSEVILVEDYVSFGDGICFTNAVTEFVVGENAACTHYMLERENSRAYNISTLQIQQSRHSHFTSHTVLLGGAIVRNNVNPVLAGEGCDSLINGLYVLGGHQAADNHMRVEHAAPHGNSRQYYQGIMTDRSRGMFRGRIIVRPGAQKTDAVQSNKNLLLSDDASVNSDPQLEIYADDVKCTHGSTTGQIDRDAIFYLRSRGISDQAARTMLIYAFAAESLGRMKLELIRDTLGEELAGRLSALRTSGMEGA